MSASDTENSDAAFTAKLRAALTPTPPAGDVRTSPEAVEGTPTPCEAVAYEVCGPPPATLFGASNNTHLHEHGE